MVRVPAGHRGSDEPDGDDGRDARDRPGPPRRLGGALARAWVGYQTRLDEAMVAEGFADRRFPDMRALRICTRADGATISHIGRELGITRQGASKLVNGLLDRGYVTLQPSPADRREKIVTVTPRARDRLAAQRAAALQIEAELRAELGPESWESLHRLLDSLAAREQPRMSDYLRNALGRSGLTGE